MKSFNLLLLSILAISYANAFDPGLYLSTKTVYQFEEHEKTEPPPSCEPEPIHFNFLIRHGAREPTGSHAYSKYLELQSTLNRVGKLVTLPQFQWMKSWKSPYDREYIGQLTLVGQEEHYNISKNLLMKYPSIFDRDYHPETFYLRSTGIDRTSESASAFSFGCWEGKGKLGKSKFRPVAILSKDKYADETLRFFDACPLYQKTVEKNQTYLKESTKFAEKYYSKITSEILQTIGVSRSDWNMTKDELLYLFTGCGYDIAIDGQKNHFCSLFSLKNLQLLDFGEDLKQYWVKSYPVKINYQMSCTLLTEFFQKIDDVIDGFDQAATLRFGHAETLIPFLTLLGLYKEENPLRADWDLEKINNRIWKGSRISPFSANVAWVTYNCTGEYRVKMLHNEREVKFPGCTDLYCPLNTLKKMHASSTGCNLKEICKLDQENQKPSKSNKNQISNFPSHAQKSSGEFLEPLWKLISWMIQILL